MLQISAGWVNPTSEGRKAIQACAETAPFLPRIESAHQAIAATAQPEESNPRLAEISKEEQALDLRHDDILRGVYLFLTGAAYLLGMQTDGAKLIALRDGLLPDGLESVNKTYRAQSGQAAQLADRLAPVAAMLQSIAVGPGDDGHSLKTFVDEWVEHGKRLGELEDEKGRLQATPPSASAFEQLQARNGWVRVANALLANAEMAELGEKAKADIFGPMWAAESVADRRGQGSVKGKAAPPAGAGSGGTTG